MLAAPVYTARQISGIKAACLAGREVLDLAAAACRPGVTTDEIDRVVREGFRVSRGYVTYLRTLTGEEAVAGLRV